MKKTLYQKMYAIVCSAASDAVELLASSDAAMQARNRLQQALLSAEELYLSSVEDDCDT